jgi:hypothetical protein
MSKQAAFPYLSSTAFGKPISQASYVPGTKRFSEEEREKQKQTANKTPMRNFPDSITFL